MEVRMKEPYEKGVAIRSAPSFALGAVKCPVKRKQGKRWAGYRASKNVQSGRRRCHPMRKAIRSRRAQARLETPCTRTGRNSEGRWQHALTSYLAPPVSQWGEDGAMHHGTDYGRNREWSSAGSASAKGGMQSPPPFAGRCPQKRVRVRGCLMIFSLMASVESEDDEEL
jgi:hypothetical protein